MTSSPIFKNSWGVLNLTDTSGLRHPSAFRSTKFVIFFTFLFQQFFFVFPFLNLRRNP